MKGVVLITGSGLVAQCLAERLFKRGYVVRFLSRHKRAKNYFLWDVERKYLDRDALIGVNHIVHLAGKNVMQHRWATKIKYEIMASRVDSARLILEGLKYHNITLESFISASAIGYYGSVTTEHNYVETDDKGHDFLSDVCDRWERAADAFAVTDMARRVIKLRIGLVLSMYGGALPKLCRLIRYYLGAPLGTGCQYVPWIHIDDLCRIIEYVIEQRDTTGVFNAVAPEHITNKGLIKSIAQVLDKPVFMPHVPQALLKLLLGEASQLLLCGSKVSSEKLLNKGFVFDYACIKAAVQSMCRPH